MIPTENDQAQQDRLIRLKRDVNVHLLAIIDRQVELREPSEAKLYAEIYYLLNPPTCRQ